MRRKAQKADDLIDNMRGKRAKVSKFKTWENQLKINKENEYIMSKLISIANGKRLSVP